MKNYQIEGKDGKLYWVHRAVSTSVFLFAMIDGAMHILAAKRGSGASDHQGLWNVPCGYLDFDETLDQCAVRELREETSFILEPEDLVPFDVTDSPTAFKQNISHKFCAVLDEGVDLTVAPGTEGEPNEVEEVKWIPVNEISQYEWAFDHEDYIRRLVSIIELSV
jgi:8-oxo-dGTP diphosphatase